MNMTREMMVYYTHKMPGVLFEDKVSPDGGRYTKVSWQGRSYTTTEFTTIDDMVLKALIDYNPEAPKERPEPFAHTHTAEEWDSYKTASGKHEVAVNYQEGEFNSLMIKGEGFYGTVTLGELDQIQELITALHAAVAGIHKRGSQP